MAMKPDDTFPDLSFDGCAGLIDGKSLSLLAWLIQSEQERTPAELTKLAARSFPGGTVVQVQTVINRLCDAGLVEPRQIG